MRSAADVVLEIERRVADGVLRPGDRLPPVRTLAHQVGLAPNTVAAAYRTLQGRGIVIGRGRSGTFVTARPPLPAASMVPVPAGVVDLSTGNPDPAFLPDPSGALTADAPLVLYGAPPTDPTLAEAAAAWIAQDSFGAEPPMVVSGALDGMERVLAAHLRPGDRVAVEDPAYASVLELLTVLSLMPVPVDHDDDGPLPDQFEAALRSGVQAVVLTPRAQNPRGSTVSSARADRLREALARHESVVVIEDDHAGRVSGAPLYSVIDASRPRWAYLRSAAKELGPDLRVALVASDPTTRHRLLGRQRVGPGWVSHHLQRAVAHLLTDPAASSLLTDAAAAYAARRERVIARLAAAGVTAHGRSGLNVWVPVADEALVVAGMRERGFAVRGGFAFRLKAGPGIRITVAAHGFERLDRAVDALIGLLGEGEGLRSG